MDDGFEFHRGSASHGPGDESQFSDFFSSIFGSVGQRDAKSHAFRARGENQHAAIDISIDDALNGVERKIKLSEMEPDASGKPTLVNHTLRLKFRWVCIRVNSFGSVAMKVRGMEVKRQVACTWRFEWRPTRCTA